MMIFISIRDYNLRRENECSLRIISKSTPKPILYILQSFPSFLAPVFPVSLKLS